MLLEPKDAAAPAGTPDHPEELPVGVNARSGSGLGGILDTA